MLTAQLMKSMDADHLVASARAEIDPLISTPLELELLDRLETLLDEAHDNQPIVDLIDEYEVSTDDMKAIIESHPASLKDQAALLSLLDDQNIHEPDQLKDLLNLAAKLRALASDAKDLSTHMNDLVSTNQEKPMFPMTVTINNPAQLNAVMAALNAADIESAKIPPCAGHDAETAKEEAKGKATAAKKEAAKTEAKPEAQAAAETAQAAEQKPEARTKNREAAVAGHANNPADAPTYQATADAVTKLARTKNREAAVAVLTKFGASKLPDVKPEHFAALIAACEAAGV